MQSKIMMIGLGVIVGVVLSAGVVLAGNLTPSAGPTESDAQVFNLAQIYARLQNGAPGVKATTFTEPSAGPSTPTMADLNQIMAIAPAVNDSAGARAGQVPVGKTFWGLRSDGWGTLTGSMPSTDGPTIVPTTTTQTVIDGVYNSDITITGDPDLLPGNISQGYTLFGVEGTFDGGQFYITGLPKTGQVTNCFVGDPGVKTPCPEDAQRGVPLPTPRFVIDNFVVIDQLTGLMWTRDAALGANCSGADAEVDWSTALASVAQCNTLNYPGNLAAVQGYNDWRLPNTREILSLINYEYVNPIDRPALSNAAGTAIWTDNDPFTMPLPIELRHWTSTTHATDQTKAWQLIGYLGTLFARGKADGAFPAHVWAVRGGE